VALAALDETLKGSSERRARPLQHGRTRKEQYMQGTIGLAAFTTLWLITGATSARDMDDQYAVFGVGAENCATYLVARDQAGAAERWYHHWLNGYLTAVNNAGASTYNILGDKGMTDILDWLEGYCAANPNSNFSNAVADMVTLLYADRQNIAPGKKAGWTKFTDSPASREP
jgi:hypothetical protein